MAANETARTILSITSKAALMTMQTILKEIEKAKSTGKQSLHSLSSKNVPLDSIPITNIDIKEVQKRLKEYGVDFAVVKDKKTQDFTLYFKGTDTVAIMNALDDLLNEKKELDTDKDNISDKTEEKTEPDKLEQEKENKPLDEQVKSAQEKADKINAEKSAEKSQELKRTVDREQVL